MNSTLAERKTAEILYVEDNEDDILLVQNLLGTRSIQVTGAQNLSSARQLLSGRKFDMVLLDHVLPDGNGLSFIEELWWCYPDVPVILITGRKDESLALAAIRKGATNFVLKDEINEDLYPTVIEGLGWLDAEAAVGVSDWHIPPDVTDKLTPWLEPYHAPKKEAGDRFLVRAGEFYQTILSNLTEGCVVVDVDGLVTFMNAPAERILELSANHLLGNGVWEIFSEETVKVISTRRFRMKSMSRPMSFTFDGHVLRNAGHGMEDIAVAISCRFLITEGGDYKGCLLLFSEIPTEAKQPSRRT